jgi:transcriptional regulator with XRE-family HTH domain
MRYNALHALRGPLRTARLEQGLTQAALAARSGTSRVTIARLEGGSARDVRVATIASLCEALGLEIAAVTVGARPTLETVLARERERSRRLDLRRRHAALAARLLAARRPKAAAQVAAARAVVDRWEREGLCSRHYVSRWRAMLALPVERVALALLEPGEWGDALLQNTPWTFALEPAAP